jgi:hypothetical protein
MIAKLITWAPTRDQASATLSQALADSVLYGVESNRDYLRQILVDAPFASGQPWTRCLEGLTYSANDLRSAKRRHPDHRAGFPRPPRLLGGRRAAVRADGQTAPCAWAIVCSATTKAPPDWKSP